MPTFAVTVRRQVAHSCVVEAKDATEAKRLAREGSDKCEWVGQDDIYPRQRPSIISCDLDY